MKYGISIELKDLVTGPSGSILSSLSNIERQSDSVMGNVSRLGAKLRNSLTGGLAVKVDDAELKQIESEIAKKKELIVSLNGDAKFLKDVDNDIKAIERELSALERKRTKINASIDSSQIDNTRKKLDEMKAFRLTLNASSNTKEIEKDVRQLERELGVLSRKKEVTINALVSNSSAIDDLKAKISSIKGAKVEVRANTSELKALESELSKLDKRRSVISVKATTETSAIDKLNSVISEKRSLLVDSNLSKDIDKDIAKIEAELLRLEKPITISANVSSNIAETSKKLTEMKAFRSEIDVTANVDSAKKEIQDLESKLLSLKKAKVDNNSLDALRGKLKALSIERSKLNIDSSAFRRASDEVDSLKKKIDNLENKKSGNFGMLDFVKGNLIFSAVQGGLSAIKDGFSGAMSLEQTKTTFGTFSENKAVQRAMLRGKPFDEKQVRGNARTESNNTIGELNKYADATSFENSDLLNVGAKMSGYMDQGDIVKKVKMFGDISGGDVGKLQGLELVYSQIKDAGKMQGQDLGQLINSGAYGIIDELAKVKKIDASKVRDAMKEGSISFQDVDKALTNMTSKGGTFFGVMDAQAKTTMGRLSTLIGSAKTKLDEFLIAKDFPVLSQLIDFGTAVVSNIELIGVPIMNLVKAFEPLTSSVTRLFYTLTGGTNITESVQNVFSAFGVTIDILAGSVNFLSTVVGYLIDLPMVQWITGIVGGIYLLNGAIMLISATNPFLLLIAGVALAVSGIKYLWENSEGFKNGVLYSWGAIKGAWEGVKNAFTGGIDYITGKVNSFVGFFTSIWDKITNPAKLSFSDLFTTVKNILAGITELVINFNPFVLAYKIANSIRQGVKDGVSGVDKQLKIDAKVREIKQGGGASLLPSNVKGVNNNKPMFLAPFPSVFQPKKEKKDNISNTNIRDSKAGATNNKSLSDKSKVNDTMQNSKPTVVNVTFGSVVGVNTLNQTVSSDIDLKARSTEIGDLVSDYLIRRISSSVAIAN